MLPLLKVRILENQHFITDKITHYNHLEFNQAMKIFFPSCYEYELVDENDKAHICIIGIQHENNDLIRDNEFNILINIENLSVGRIHYQHFNIFNRFNNNKIQLYYYNDINYLSYNTVPIPLCFIRQFNYLQHLNTYNNILTTPYENKKFCLAISKNCLNINKMNIFNILSNIGYVDHISDYDDYILNKSCYNSIELLRVFNQYKFIICFENSKTDSYITEKIFNVFLAKSIPIYDGAPNIYNYINEDAIITYDQYFLNKILFLSNNKEIYNTIINKPKINIKNININDFEKKLEIIFQNNLKRIQNN